LVVPPSTPLLEQRTAVPLSLAIVATGGSSSVLPTELRNRLLADGATLSGTQNPSFATFQLLCRSSALDDALELMSSLVAHPRFADNEVDFRKRMRETWLEKSADSPARLADLVERELLFGAAHPFGSWLGERGEEIRAMSRDDLVRSYESLRNPSAMVIGVAGSYDDVELRPKLERLFGSLPIPKGRTGGSSPPVPPAPAPPGRLVLVDRPAATTSIVRVGGALPPVHGTEEFAGLVLEEGVLGQVGFGRLNERLDHELALTDKVDCTYWHDSLASYMTIGATVPVARTAEALRAMQGIVATIGREGVSPDELDRAKSRLLAEHAGSFERVADISAALVSTAGLGDDPQERLQSFADRVQAITSEDVRQFAARAFPPDRMTTVIVGEAKSLRMALEREGYSVTETRDARGRR
jgi:zinc protease